MDENQLNNYVQQCEEKENTNNQLRKERDEMQINIIEKNTLIQKLTSKIDELENTHSVEILDTTPQQQSKEIKQLQANIESYKKTIHILKEHNETLNNDLLETSESFDKVEEENSDLKEQLKLLGTEVDKFETKNRLHKNRESKDADKINKLIKRIDDITKENDEQNRLHKNRESKDADKMNKLIKRNDDISKENETITKDNTEMKQHIENFQSVIDQQNNLHKNRESKDADKINYLLKSNDDIRKENETIKKDNTEKSVEDISKMAECDKYTQSLVAENDQLLEELEKLRINVKQLNTENDMNQTNVQNLTEENNNLKEQTISLDMKYRSLADKCQSESMEADAEVTQKFVELQKKYHVLQENLQKETEQNGELLTIKKQLEQQVSNNRKELSTMQQQMGANNVSKKDFNDMQDRLVAAQRASEQHKRDGQQTCQILQLKIKNVKDLQEKVNELTTEVVAAKELIEDLQEKEIGAMEMIAELREKERRKNIESTQLRDQVEEVTVLRMQKSVEDVSKMDERDEYTQSLVDENNRLSEELEKLLIDVQQLNTENDMKQSNVQNLTEENNHLKEQTVSLDMKYKSLADKCQSESMEADGESTQRRELNMMQQQMEANNTSKKDFNDMQDRLVAAQRASEKHKRDSQQTWQTLQLKVKDVKVDLYKNDFQAERDSRENQQTALLEERECVEQLQLVNRRLKEWRSGIDFNTTA